MGHYLSEMDDYDSYMSPKSKVIGKGRINIAPVGHEFETASDYVMDKNKELYDRFSLKELIESRIEGVKADYSDQIDYDDFLLQVSEATGYTVETLNCMFDERNDMRSSVADYLAKRFDLPREVWLSRNHYVNFSPDWSSPVGDTIKDLLEERGENYDDFVDEITRELLSCAYSVERVEAILDGQLEMPASLALFLSEKLGSTEGFWLTRSADYRIQRELEDSKKLREVYLSKSKPISGDLTTLERIISQCLSAQVKMFDVPYSASSHLNMAIALLSQLVPDYNPDDEEMRQALEWAISEGKILRGEE